MKEQLRACILKGIEGCFADGTLASGQIPALTVEKPAHPEHGDFATNVAMQMAKPERKSPRAIAEIIVNRLAGSSDLIDRLEIAGPGEVFREEPGRVGVARAVALGNAASAIKHTMPGDFLRATRAEIEAVAFGGQHGLLQR